VLGRRRNTDWVSSHVQEKVDEEETLLVSRLCHGVVVVVMVVVDVMC